MHSVEELIKGARILHGLILSLRCPHVIAGQLLDFGLLGFAQHQYWYHQIVADHYPVQRTDRYQLVTEVMPVTTGTIAVGRTPDKLTVTFIAFIACPYGSVDSVGEF